MVTSNHLGVRFVTTSCVSLRFFLIRLSGAGNAPIVELNP
jgi:hypothetical protein